MNEHGKLNYVEFPCTCIPKTKAFFEQAFGWSFVDYGPDYTSFANQGLDGGFFTSDLSASTKAGSALLVLYSARLEETLAKVQAAGGLIVQPIFAFPGGAPVPLHGAQRQRVCGVVRVRAGLSLPP